MPNLPPRETGPLHSALRQTLYSTYCEQQPLRRISRTFSPLEFLRFLSYINIRTVKSVVRSTLQRRLPSLASEMAYNAMLGLFPGILALLTAIGLVNSLKNTFTRLAMNLGEIAPGAVNDLIQNFANEVSAGENKGLFSISFVISLWASSGAISAAMRALDEIHQIPVEQRRPFWKARLLSIGLTIGTIMLLMIASYLVFISAGVIKLVAQQSGGSVGVWVLRIWELLTWPLALGIVSSAFAFVYRFGPSRWTRGKPLMPGAVLAALSWALLSASFRLYVAQFGNYNKVYGAIGTVIILLLWLFLTSLVMLIGDQLNVTVGELMIHSPRVPLSRPKRKGSQPGPNPSSKLPSLDKSTINKDKHR
ncbi:YihY/virulence factor BrkB family protein [Leptothoe sp. PORK10 BA2]|uniref:YihY/virulence factor BrkB family protein n=1 Tax=Leptothoe sp. PORK10 BA2 TaxID=3110254 RepID=UPI002B2063B8|nr:YihY/virulence factor BrkB family protein [Leptothoe sp. PORK10 BA2]MEA5462102.1 YihY/virulence factor BrkB family protein [Leptothoe sp. PORK10 BA2]